MLTLNTYALFVLFVILIASACAFKLYNTNGDCVVISIVGMILSGINILCISIVSLIGPASFCDNPIINTGSTPILVQYVQYHPFTENTIERTVLLPKQAKLLKKSQILKDASIAIDEL